jgi:hypothetical protein
MKITIRYNTEYLMELIRLAGYESVNKIKIDSIKQSNGDEPPLSAPTISKIINDGEGSPDVLSKFLSLIATKMNGKAKIDFEKIHLFKVE